MIDFKAVTVEDREVFERYLWNGEERGCERSFTNMFLWGQQSWAVLGDCLVSFAVWEGRCAYPFPVGPGDKKAVLDAIIADAAERGVPCVLGGVTAAERQLLEELYPGQFVIRENRDGSDYVYAIDDLADLRGKKFHGKRNHLHRFQEAFPNYRVEPLTEENLPLAKAMVDEWYAARLAEDPDGDFDMEQEALKRAFANYRALGMDGLMLLDGETVLAMTMGSRMSENTVDVHFEKARADVEGAYPTINCEFARYIRDKYPEVQFLDREEDMGLEGLRKSKLSYHPHHMVQKHWARRMGDVKIDVPDVAQVPELRALWKEAFGDTDDFLDEFWSTAYAPERCRCVTVDGQVAAVLYWFDCECRGERVAYVYAVATAEAFRGLGLSHKLMEATHQYLAAQGYAGVLLVPGSESLFRFYAGQGYETCSHIQEVFCTAAESPEEEMLSAASLDTTDATAADIRRIDLAEYARLRRRYLPEGAVLQEGENLAFLATQAEFYAGPGFVLAAAEDDGVLCGIELLGDTTAAPGILQGLGYREGTFRQPGEERPFAMYYPLDEDVPAPMYFGLAFD